MSNIKRTPHAEWYGHMDVMPQTSAAAGSYQTFKLTYTVGKYGMDNGGRIRLLFRYAWDGGIPQTKDPKAENYVTATTSNPDASVDISFVPKGGRRPWMRSLVFEIKDDSLAEGDQVFMTIGDTASGNRGHQVQSFVESDFRWLTDVECFESGTWVELENNPLTPIVPGSPIHLTAMVPSVRQADEPFRLTVKWTDNHGNPAASTICNENIRNNISIELHQQQEDGQFVRVEYDQAQFHIPEKHLDDHTLAGCCHFDQGAISSAGQFRFVVKEIEGSGLEAMSNVITITRSKSKLSHYWADLHGQYNNALGAGSVVEAFRYARDAGAVDMVGHQPNDFQLRQEGWEEAQYAVKQFHRTGEFLPFLGYEWSGTTPSGGDRNVHFLNDVGDLHRSSHWHVPDQSDEHMDRYPLDQLYDTFKGRKDVLLLPHVGGRRCDISRYYDPELEPVIEICSCHGRFEWLLREALDNGYTVGVVGGSDDHTGRPGAAHATSHAFGTRGGLAGIYAAKLTKESVFEALRARHTYATTGERIWLHVDTPEGYMMGDVIPSDTNVPMMQIRVAATAPIERIDIMRNQDLVYTYPIFSSTTYRDNLIRLEWGGARVKGRGRHSHWDGFATLEGATIKNAKTFAFDHPKQGIIEQDNQEVRWSSTTSGDHDGIVMELADLADDAMLHFHTSIHKSSIKLRDLSAQPIRYDCGDVDQYCSFSLQPSEDGPLTVDFSWQDSEPVQGRNAYWIRVTQKDGEMAWSSPLYVDLA